MGGNVNLNLNPLQSGTNSNKQSKENTNSNWHKKNSPSQLTHKNSFKDLNDFNIGNINLSKLDFDSKNVDVFGTSNNNNNSNNMGNYGNINN